MSDDTAKIGVAIFIGGLIGASIALLYAPKSGSRTRKDIEKAIHRAKNSTADLIEDAIDDVNDFINCLKEKASDIMDQGTDLTDKTKREIMTTLEHGQKALEKQKQIISGRLGI
ncbi:MAG: YtxH domain-containing protein [Smithellaceae bacterium]